MFKLSDRVRAIITSKERYNSIYHNTQSDHINKTFRKQAFTIKSRLTGNATKDSQLYIPINYAAVVSHAYADFEVGKGYDVSFGEGHEDLDERVDELRRDLMLDKKIYDKCVQKSVNGYSVLRLRYDDHTQRAKLESIPMVNYMVNLDGLPLGSTWDDIKQHAIVSVAQLNDKKVAYVTTYTKEESERGGWMHKHAIYPFSGAFNFDKVNPIGEVTEERIPHLPLFVLQNDLMDDVESYDVYDMSRWAFANALEKNKGASSGGILAQSDYVNLFDLLQDINDAVTQISVERNKHLMSKMSLPASTVGMLQQVSPGQTPDKPLHHDYEWYIHDQGDTPAQYITKDTAMTKMGEQCIERNIRAISTITSVPLSFLGIEQPGGAQHVGTIEKQFEQFYQRVEQRRLMIANELRRLYALLVYIDAGGQGEMIYPTITFPKLRINDMDRKATTYSTLRASGLVSQHRAIAAIHDLDGEELDEEIQRLNDEEIINTHIQPTTAFDG